MKARPRKAEQETPAPDVSLTFPRMVVIPMPKRIAEKPRGGMSLEDTAWLLRVGIRFTQLLKEQTGGQIIHAAPLESWHRLSRLCAMFDTGGFGAVLIKRLSAHEDAPERAKARAAKAENDAELKRAADALRALEPEEEKPELRGRERGAV